ncbi:exodeoxyribonuclease V subunit gamma [[Haemophilus] felis]|uniref:RecBCD enzyme subunit RecC n=1 Tax=[Haemophilus] felis TaxID=123822 RepID=A0A1T0BC68_9PAST|nr:exodeoxyribonuclease V subunit gamma [[Haemophilus] felis]OOS07586.1 exodeoxyribonuclease V subunit gamma [[Haemophilus] felis]
MFVIYHSNDLDVQKDLLLEILDKPLTDPFESEVILVQSPGMAQWLQWKIAEAKGVVSNIKFPLPASFIWQQYALNLTNVEAQNPFNKTSITWRLMRLITNYLDRPEFIALRNYFSQTNSLDEQKLYQLAYKIADLFDQYLVYRPEWINYWETNEDQRLWKSFSVKQGKPTEQLFSDVVWQGILWRALVKDIQQQYQSDIPLHRANLQQQFLQLLNSQKTLHLPKRIFVFGIAALPSSYLETLQGMSKHCEVHLFFTNMCKAYWGDLIDEHFLQKLRVQQRECVSFEYPQKLRGALEKVYVVSEQQNAFEITAEQEWCFSGHPLLSSWGKLGRDFLYLLTQLEQQDNVYGIQAYVESNSRTLLTQVQSKILNLDSNNHLVEPAAEDRSLTFHSCHSQMREVEVLHDYLLRLFQENPEITPKDVVVMSADIDSYTPYIHAVFGQKSTDVATRIPFSIADNKLTENDVLIASFIHLLNLKSSQFSAEELLGLLDVPAIREKFQINLADLSLARYWIEKVGIRYGLDKYQVEQTNYNAWQSGLENMLLGHGMREENGIWQDSLGFDSSYGLQGQLVGKLCEYIERLKHWQQKLQLSQSVAQWQQDLLDLVEQMFIVDEQNVGTLTYLQQTIIQCLTDIQQSQFNDDIGIEVLTTVLEGALQEDPNNMRFLVGKVNFCTLLPMRSIPFKVVCLLGMNDGEYPRQHTPNSFDLMQYDRRKGDRFRRDDDCYLFLEALLSAQSYFYVSFIGRSIVDNRPKEPSVLVNQLLDYLKDCLAHTQSDWREKLVQQHSMTAFNPLNFSQEPRSFAQHWLPLAQVERSSGANDFLHILDYQLTDEDRHISLTELIRFVQNPVAFFFQQRLGVYFSVKQEEIPECENFDLDGLTSYFIKNELLYCDPSQDEEVFEKLNIKGVMPRGAFAEIYQQQQQQNVQSLRENIAPYLAQTADLQPVHFIFSTSQGEVKLEGNLNNLYGRQMVFWHAGSVKDKHIIELWIRYLVQCAVCEDVDPPIFYASDGSVTFSSLDTTDSLSAKQYALAQLQIYIESYLLSYRQLILLPTQNIEKYAKNLMNDEAVSLDKLQSFLQKNAVGDQYSGKGDIYWQRVLAQQTFDTNLLEEIHLQWVKWFNPLLKHLSKSKT